LIVVSSLASFCLDRVGIPAALFLGPMLVAICFGVKGVTIRLPKPFFQASQGVVGVLIAHSMTAAVLLMVATHWPIMLMSTALTVLLSVLVGVILVRFGGLPGSTAAWGTTPGAASAMVAMAEEYGADSRIVATMQYMRVVCVVVISALVGRFLGVEGTGTASHTIQLALDWNTFYSFGLTLIVVAVGVWLGKRLPAGALMVPIALGTVLQLNGWLMITLPHWLLAIAFGAMGCYVGLRFDRTTIRYVTRALPKMVLASLMLIAMCALSALLLAHLMDRDFLSAYLATSPGGLDSMAIIAVDSHADVGLVMAMQALRLIGVIASGPFLARQIARVARA
jgi:membrane AbrB-like protein